MQKYTPTDITEWERRRPTWHVILASLLSLITKGLNQTPTNIRAKMTHFTVSKNWHNKNPLGRLGEIAPAIFWLWGRSPPWSRRLWLIYRAL